MIQIDDGWAKFLLGSGLTLAAAVVRNLIHQALMDKRLRDVERKLDKLPNAIAGIDRRTLYMLQLMADMAKHSGLDRRVPDDLLINLMTQRDGD